MTDNVIPLGNITYLDNPPDRILEQSIGKLEGCIVIGFDHEGGEYFCSSVADGGTVIWWLERAKFRLMQLAQDEQP